MLNPLDLSGKFYLVTGASSGIGRATSVLLSQLGAKVVLAARDVAKLQQTSQMLAGAGHVIEKFDFASSGLVADWASSIVKQYGAFDGLVHCAGTRFTLPLKMTDIGVYRTTFDTNVSSAISLAQAFAKKGVSKTNCSIVLIASVLGIVGSYGVSAYAASKGAIIALTKSLAAELARNKIRVNCVAPGVVKTEMIEKVAATLTPMQLQDIEAQHLLGLGEPIDVANSIVFLLSDAAKWITGSTLVVDGGYTAR